MRIKTGAAVALATALIGTGIAYASTQTNHGGRTAAEYFKGHWHDDDGEAHGAPAHSGGTDAAGCHNGSVPYHCH